MVLHQAAGIQSTLVYDNLDKIKNGEVKVAYCHTVNMLADFFTKPLQGNAFIWMQEKIVNLPRSTSTTVHRSVLNNENKNNEIKQMARSQKYSDPREPGSSNLVGRKVIWAYRTKAA